MSGDWAIELWLIPNRNSEQPIETERIPDAKVVIDRTAVEAETDVKV